jgi:hypothetical protein
VKGHFNRGPGLWIAKHEWSPRGSIRSKQYFVRFFWAMECSSEVSQRHDLGFLGDILSDGPTISTTALNIHHLRDLRHSAYSGDFGRLGRWNSKLHDDQRDREWMPCFRHNSEFQLCRNVPRHCNQSSRFDIFGREFIANHSHACQGVANAELWGNHELHN